jgi:hypothetical protein
MQTTISPYYLPLAKRDLQRERYSVIRSMQTNDVTATKIARAMLTANYIKVIAVEYDPNQSYFMDDVRNAIAGLMHKVSTFKEIPNNTERKELISLNAELVRILADHGIEGEI